MYDVSQAKQVTMLWFWLPRYHPSDIKELIMAQLGKDALKIKEGMYLEMNQNENIQNVLDVFIKNVFR